MSRRTLAIAVVIFGLFAAWMVFRSRPPPSDEDLIRAAIHDLGRLAERHDVSGIIEHVSERYRGEAGDRQELKGYLAAYLMRADWVGVMEAKVAVEVKGDRATSSFTALLLRSPAASLADVHPEGLAGSHLIEAEWVKEEAGWKILKATRRDATTSDWLK